MLSSLWSKLKLEFDELIVVGYATPSILDIAHISALRAFERASIVTAGSLLISRKGLKAEFRATSVRC